MFRIKMIWWSFVLCLLCLCLDVNSMVLPKPKFDPNERPTCIIGAGVSGLAAARYLQQNGLNFTVFEATNHIGGTWFFDVRTGVDEQGIPLFTNMYKQLRTNTPRQTMEFGGFPMPDDTPSYPAGPCFYKYLQSFAMTFNLMDDIQFRKYVTMVQWAGDGWNVTLRDADTSHTHTESCGFLIVATGHETKPRWPEIDGEQLFNGNIIHSKNYRDPENYRGRKVLLIGAGASGLDLATQLSQVAAKVVHSHHLVYNQPVFPATYVKKPDIKMFVSNGVVFEDGSFEEIDDVIYCTGYDFDHSFLHPNTGLTTSGKFVLPLYRHMVNIRHPSMVVVGATKTTITRVLDAQAEYAAALAAGKFTLPPQDEMLKSWLDHVYGLNAQGKGIIDVNFVGIQNQDQYFANLTAEAGITRGPPVLTDIMKFNAKIRLDDLLHYREYEFTIIDDKHYERKHNPRKELSCPTTI